MQNDTSTVIMTRDSGFSPTRAWWKSAVVYQIYPISFFDSNGDGLGDLNGLYTKLDYLKDLGVDVIWVCPIYKSPLKDMGYDISDYQDIDPRYGTLEDWDKLLAGVHERGMKLLMDLVVNHTSDQHAWFRESRSSKTNPKRDWYIWRPPRYDAEGRRMPPNNWKGNFQGSAWEYDKATEEYYLHLFVTEQPDLNWENPEVREAVWGTMRFWLDRGCDGFRVRVPLRNSELVERSKGREYDFGMDVINMISKVDGLPDAVVTSPGEPYQPAGLLYANGPKVHQYIKEMHERVLSHYITMTVGETPLTHRAEDIAAYVLPRNKELNMVFQFEVVDMDSGGTEGGAEAVSPLTTSKWTVLQLKNIVRKWQQYKREEGYWNSVYIENHDNARSVSRFGNDSDEWRAPSAKLLAMMQATQSGTLFVYQGEEIGMKNFPRSWGIEEYLDVATINFWAQYVA
ncbi:hypothetical protein EIP86_002191 [Pleurotus ostreatoroseus]|nr:hypothetical protein EIP86_002191 [Pleurotus ostreatoroseus]